MIDDCRMTAASASMGKWTLESCAKRTCPARITTKAEQLLEQIAGHNHPVDAEDCHSNPNEEESREKLWL